MTRCPDGRQRHAASRRGVFAAGPRSAERIRFEDLADRHPRRPFDIRRQPRRHQVHEGQEHRLDRQVVPFHVEGGRPHQHAPAADAALHQRRRPVVEPRDDLGVGDEGQRPIAIEAGGGEVAAARRTERFEDRMTVLERAEPRGLAASCDRRARPAAPAGSRFRSPATPVRGPATSSSPPPPWTNVDSRVAVSCETGVSFRTTMAARCRSSTVSPSIDLIATSNGRRLTERQRARQIQAARRAARPAVRQSRCAAAASATRRS